MVFALTSMLSGGARVEGAGGGATRPIGGLAICLPTTTDLHGGDGNRTPPLGSRWRSELPQSMTTQAALLVRCHGMNVSRMCPATDRKKLLNDGQCRSAKLLVTGTFGLIRRVPETVRVG